MEKSTLKELGLPDKPGVYRFLDNKGKVLYVGKATSLRDRVRSYFANDILHTRGKHILDMVASARTVAHTVTDSVLEALILEASLIKRLKPYYNTKEKDDKSFNYVVITKDTFPAIMKLRERNMLVEGSAGKEQYRFVFGPFTRGSDLDEALRIIRRIFPFRTTCTPGRGKPCFDRQIGLCPGVCTGEISEKEYKETIRNIADFFRGNKLRILSRMEVRMKECAHELCFEEAGEYKRKMFALRHIKDSSLIRDEIREHSQDVATARTHTYRIEAYDISHISGTHTVGVMTVVADGIPKRSGYRMFKIREKPDHPDDTLHLKEVLRRRLLHTDWPLPDLIVVDGGVAQKRVAEKLLKEHSLTIPVIGVVKNDRHKPSALLGNKELALSYERWILIGNAESHRFAVAYHRKLRDKVFPK